MNSHRSSGQVLIIGSSAHAPHSHAVRRNCCHAASQVLPSPNTHFNFNTALPPYLSNGAPPCSPLLATILLLTGEMAAGFCDGREGCSAMSLRVALTMALPKSASASAETPQTNHAFQHFGKTHAHQSQKSSKSTRPLFSLSRNRNTAYHSSAHECASAAADEAGRADAGAAAAWGGATAGAAMLGRRASACSLRQSARSRLHLLSSRAEID